MIYPKLRDLMQFDKELAELTQRLHVGNPGYESALQVRQSVMVQIVSILDDIKNADGSVTWRAE